MVGAAGAGDAVARARRLGDLRVGLHLVIPDFDDNMVRAGVRMFFDPRARRQLAAALRAQFEAFRATGLVLDHVNGHKHIHLHPTIARLVVEIGGDYGMRAVRVPDEPTAVLRCASPDEVYRAPPWNPVVGALRRRLARAGLAVNDQVFGIAWSGGMVEERMLALLPHLPDGVSEIYCHPSVAPFPDLPGYRPREELAALLSPAVRELISALGIELTSHGALAAAG
jgi:hopanoid biosynthesis associated protein HpnK